MSVLEPTRSQCCLFGGIVISVGFSIDSLCMTTSSVSHVAVALNAKTFTSMGFRLRTLPIFENVVLNSSPQVFMQWASSISRATKFFVYCGVICIACCLALRADINKPGFFLKYVVLGDGILL